VRAFWCLGLVAALAVLAACTGSSSHPAAKSSHSNSTSSSAGSSSASSVDVTRVVPAPSGGNISQTVSPSATESTAAAVPLTAPAHLEGGVVITLARIQAINVGAEGPGEVAGAALAVTVHVDNESSQSVDMSSAVVTLLDANGNVGNPTPASPAAPFTGAIQPKASADGVYVFNIATNNRNPINVFVSYSGGALNAHFVGNAS
jgi:hypothetical protein